MDNNKKWLVLLTALFSSNLYANIQPYVGADALISNKFDTPDVFSGLYGKDVDTGFALQVGARFPITTQFEIELEGEYDAYGDVDYDVPNSGIRTNVSAYAFFANTKPKLYLVSDEFYLAGLLGVGEIHIKSTASNSTHTVSASVSKSVYQYGLEAGYQFNDHITVHVGYKKASFKDGYDYDFDYTGLYSGLRFYF